MLRHRDLRFHVREPTTVGSYASGIAFHPTGAVTDFTFGNQIVHSLSLNTRGLPDVNKDGAVLQDKYTYDPNGNITVIADQVGNFTRGMAYDGLDRLTIANAPAVWGNASYTYDALDNLLTSNVGSRSTTLNYVDGTNRLTSITVNGSVSPITYDPNGNIKTKGGQGYTFDLGNRMNAATLAGTYAYDGEGRRFNVVGTDGTVRLSLYSQAGQLLWAESSGTGSVPAELTYTCSNGSTPVNGQCVTTTPYYATQGHQCNAGDNWDGSACQHTEITNYGPVQAAYTCTGNDTLNSNHTCTHTYPAAGGGGYSCNAGDGAPVNNNCTHTATSTYAGTTTAYTCHAEDPPPVGSLCTHTVYSQPVQGYKCTSGTLSGSQCTGANVQGKTAYIYLGTKQIAEVRDGVTKYVHTDALGSPVAHTNGSKDVLDQTRFEAYGFVAAGTKPSAATSVIGFTGHQQDSATDLVYMQQRYYDPISGRMMSVDPVVTNPNTGSLFGRYQYGSNSPYVFVDPDGRADEPRYELEKVVVTGRRNPFEEWFRSIFTKEAMSDWAHKKPLIVFKNQQLERLRVPLVAQ